MAHVQKFTSGSASRIIGHCEREKSEHGDFLKYRSSSDIDTTKTHMNISMNFKDGLTAHERLTKRLNEVHVLKRKDVNVMCDWVITLPKELSQDLDTIKSFFNESAKFLMSRYGKENVVSCNIHMDEAQPHMHFCFVPVVFDAKKDYYKVSAKELLTKHDLKTFHTDLEEHLHETIGLEKGLIHSGITQEQGGNKTIGQLKAEKLDKAVDKQLQDLENYETLINRNISTLRNSDDWRKINYYVSELNDYQIPVEKWFKDKGSEIKFKRDKVTMPVKELETVFKAVYAIQAQDSLIKIQNSLKNEIRALYDFDPEMIEKRYESVFLKEQETNRLYEKQIMLNEKFEESEQRAKELWNENRKLVTTNSELNEKVKDLDMLLKMNNYLRVQVDKQKQEIVLLKTKNNRYEDMFDRFPEIADQLKELYKKQIQQEKIQQQKRIQAEREKQREKEWDFEI